MPWEQRWQMVWSRCARRLWRRWGGQDNADAERRLMEALASPSLTTSQRTRTIELLGRDPTPQARELLVRLANRRFVVTATARVVRDAARKALDGKKQRRSDD